MLYWPIGLPAPSPRSAAFRSPRRSVARRSRRSHRLSRESGPAGSTVGRPAFTAGRHGPGTAPGLVRAADPLPRAFQPLEVVCPKPSHSKQARHSGWCSSCGAPSPARIPRFAAQAPQDLGSEVTLAHPGASTYVISVDCYPSSRHGESDASGVMHGARLSAGHATCGRPARRKAFDRPTRGDARGKHDCCTCVCRRSRSSTIGRRPRIPADCRFRTSGLPG